MRLIDDGEVDWSERFDRVTDRLRTKRLVRSHEGELLTLSLEFDPLGDFAQLACISELEGLGKSAIQLFCPLDPETRRANHKCTAELLAVPSTELLEDVAGLDCLA